MKKTAFLLVVVLLFLCSCTINKSPENESAPNNHTTELTEAETSTKMNNEIVLSVDNKEFTVTLSENEATEEFSKMFPVSLSMSELNGNEKYCYLDHTLPTDDSAVGFIKKGDIMLYSGNCIVIFYKSFATPYKYTRIGQIKNTDGLEEALGNENAEIIFQ